MVGSRWIIAAAFIGLLVAPFAFQQGDRSAAPDDAARLIIFTPHNDQIQFEFATAFDRWHQERYGRRVDVLFNAPGGTSEIRTMLQSQFEAALEQGIEPGGNADLVFGGGTYEHEVLKRGVEVRRHGALVSHPISQPVHFETEWLRAVYGVNHIGGVKLHDPDRYWFGTALSGFGIVYNRDVLDRIGVEEPAGWDDLCSPKLLGWVALVNPAQSGSVTTAFEAILQRRGWIEGWRILRRAAANARYFSAQSNRPPHDVAQGDAAMGVCIDFYGRFQAQAVLRAGGSDRVGYIDPPGETTIDPDPISMLANAPNPTIARRFIEFVLSERGQALWQFPVSPAAPGASDLGPERFELRRLPIRRSMYESHFSSFIDQVNPYEVARPVENPNSAMRSFIPVLFAGMAIDSHDDLQAAWRAIITHPAYPQTGEIVTADDVTDPVLRQMLTEFDRLPSLRGPFGRGISLGEREQLATLRDGWLRGEWADEQLWPDFADPRSEARRQFGEFFRRTYRDIASAGTDLSTD